VEKMQHTFISNTFFMKVLQFKRNKRNNVLHYATFSKLYVWTYRNWDTNFYEKA